MTEREQLEEIYEVLVGDDGMKRYTHEELVEYCNDMKDTEQRYNDSICNDKPRCTHDESCEYQDPFIEEDSDE